MAEKKILVKLGADISGVKKAMGDAQKSVSGGTKGITSAFKGATSGVGSFVTGIGKIAGAIGVAKLVSGAFNMIKGSIDGAISRVDTLNQFPKVLQLMGYGADEASKATDRLKEGIQGLPTRLDEVVGTTQRMVNIFQDVDKATESTLALNNAFLASGASQDQANRGIEQYIQMLSAGKVDMQSWKTLQETMPYALQQTAEAFGFTGRTAQKDFYEALQSGDVTMDDFNDKLIELSEAQGGFAEVALESTKGIKTSWSNIKTAITNGVANAISAFDEWLNSNGFGGITGILDNIKTKVGEVFTSVSANIPKALDYFKNLYDTVKDSTAFQTLQEILGQVWESIKQLWDSFKESEALATTKDLALELGQALLDIDFQKIISDVSTFLEKWTPLIAGIVVGIGVFKGLTFVSAIFSAISAAGGILTIVLTGLSIAGGMLSTAFAFLTSPITLIAAAIGAVIAVGVLLYKNWDEIKAKASEVWGNMVLFFSETWELIKTGVSESWETIKGVFQTVIDTIASFVSEKFNAVKENITEIFTAVKDKVTEIWNNIKTAISSKIDEAKTAVTTKVEEIKTNITTKFNAVKETVTNIWNNIKTAISNKITEAKTAVSNKVEEIKTAVSTKFNAVKTSVTNIWNSIKTAISNKINEAKTTVSTTVDGIKTSISSKFEAVKSTVTTVWNGIKNAIKNPIESARDAVKTAIDKMKGFFDFSWSLPKLKMPSFSMTGKFSLNPPSVPKFGISWHEKGGIFQGSKDGSVVGLAENHGDEAIVPLSNKTRMRPFANAIASMMPNDDNQLATAGGDTIITGNTFVVREEADIKKVAQELKKLEDRERRPRGR